MPYIGEPYDESYYIGDRPEGYTDITDIRYWPLIVDDIEDRLGLIAGLTVLDLGCAYGGLAAELTARGANVIGVDISLHAVSVAQTRFPGITFVQSDGLNLPFANKFFDLVITSRVSTCMPDVDTLKDLVRELRRKVKSQGAAYILEDLTNIYYFTITAEQWQTEVASLFPGKDTEVTLVGHRLPADVRIVVT